MFHCRPMVLALSIVACSGSDSESGVRRESGEPVRGTVGGCWKEPRIGPGGVGSIRVGGTITFLPRSCSVRDSLLAGSLTERGHVVRYLEQELLVVVAANNTGRVNSIVILDPAFRTAGDVGVGSSVQVLRTMHEPLCALAGTDGRVTLFSERLPGVEFATSVNVPGDPARLRAMEEDVRLVPEDARITRITITEGESPCTGPVVAYGSSALTARASTVLADSLWSPSLGVKRELVVYLPPSYETARQRRYPTVTLLHGLWGDQWQYVRSLRIAAILDSLVAAGMPEMIVVMPDGDDGWWTTWNRLVDMRGCRAQSRRRRFTPASDPASREPADSYCVPWARYDDYVARDVVAKVDSSYRTLAMRARRGVAGLSMGGYGAVTIALGFPEVFGAAASHSGALSLLYAGARPFAPPAAYATDIEQVKRAHQWLWWSLEIPFGDLAGFRAREPAAFAERLVRRGETRRPSLYLDIGVDDMFLEQNRAFHHRLNELGYAHRYAELPGGHEHAYWRAHIAESLRWMAGEFASTPER